MARIWSKYHPEPGPPEITDVAPVDGDRVVAEVVISQLLYPDQLNIDGGGTDKIGLDGGGLGIPIGFTWLVDDATNDALNDQDAKLTWQRPSKRRCWDQQLPQSTHR